MSIEITTVRRNNTVTVERFFDEEEARCAFMAAGRHPDVRCVTSDDPSQAMRFASLADAMEFRETQSTVTPLRPDGEPNRPLTALTMSLEPLP